MAKSKVFLNKTDIIESWSREAMSTKRRFYKLTNLTVFAALLKDYTNGCKGDKRLPKNHTLNFVTFEEKTRQPYQDNLCLFRTPTLHLHGNQRLAEETSTLFNSFENRMHELSPYQFIGVHMNDLSVVEDLLIFKILHYHVELVLGNVIGELCTSAKCAELQKYSATTEIQQP